MKYLLAIVIPTQNRQKYCALSVKQIYDVTDGRVQIIVHDNSDDNSLQEMLAQGGYSERVEYYYVAKKIPCAENYNRAIGYTCSEYVCCIGDDDGVFAQITDFVELAKKCDIDAITPNVGAIYYWPAVSDNCEGKVILGKHNSTYRLTNPTVHLKKLLSEGCQGYLSMDLVKAYHGIVRKKYFEEVYARTGHYCGALSSDMFMCITLSLIVEKVLVIDHPLTISGACRQSTSGDAINKCNYGKLESAPHFVGQPYIWNAKVPRFYSGNTIWADSALHAFAEMGETAMISQFNLEKLSAICLLKFPQFKTDIIENLKKNNGNIRMLKKYKRKLKQNHINAKLKNKLKFIYNTINFTRRSVSKKQKQLESCENIIEAEIVLRQEIQKSIEQLMKNIEKSIERSATCQI